MASSMALPASPAAPGPEGGCGMVWVVRSRSKRLIVSVGPPVGSKLTVAEGFPSSSK